MIEGGTLGFSDTLKGKLELVEKMMEDGADGIPSQ